MADEEDISLLCNFEKGDYKTLRLEDGKIFLFKSDKYYAFDLGDIKNAETYSISEIFPYDDENVDQCFVCNDKVYYLRGDNAIIYENNVPKKHDWSRVQKRVAHLIIQRNGETTAFFVPPKSSRRGWGLSTSRSNDLHILAYGGGLLSTANIDGNYFINYNGWHLPSEFNAFMVNSDTSITFFNNDKYCTVERYTDDKEFTWEDVTTLFGC